MAQVPSSAAADRNKQPILEVLRGVLDERGHALEIASGTGQHVAWFAAALPHWFWQPTEADVRLLPVLERRFAEAGLSNVGPPLLLDVRSNEWPSPRAPFKQRFDAVYCANMLHIAPPDTCAALMQGATRSLLPGGVLLTYGPYFDDGAPAPTNLAFDQSLRARNPVWGIRRLEDVVTEAERVGLELRARHTMPANNLLLVFAL